MPGVYSELPSLKLKTNQLQNKNHLERDVLEDDDGMLGRVLLQQGLEVGRASREDHLVSLAGLAIASLEIEKVTN